MLLCWCCCCCCCCCLINIARQSLPLVFTLISLVIPCCYYYFCCLFVFYFLLFFFSECMWVFPHDIAPPCPDLPPPPPTLCCSVCAFCENISIICQIDTMRNSACKLQFAIVVWLAEKQQQLLRICDAVNIFER